MNKRKITKRAIVTLAVLAAGYFVWGLTATAKLEGALESARQKGVPLTMADLVADRPEEGNAASHIFVAAISMCRAAGDTSTWVDGYYPFGVDAPLDEIADLPEGLADVLPQYAEGIALLQRAGEMGECYFPMSASESLEERLTKRDVLGILKLSTLLVAATKARMDEGDLDGAKVAVQANFALTTALRHEPTLIVQVVGMLAADYGARSAMILAERLEDPTAWLASLHLLQGTLPGAATPLVADALAGELPFFTQALGGGEDMTAPELAELFGASDMELPDLWSLAAGTPYMRSAQASFIEYVTELIAIAKTPLHEAIDQADQLAAEVREHGNGLTRAFIINSAPMLKRYAASLSQNRLLYLGTKAHAHHAQSGTWPKDLATLGLADFLDPQTGQPYELEPTPTGLTLRTTGPDAVEWGLH